MPESSVGGNKSKLCHIIEENLPGSSILAVPRRYFSDELGVDYIEQVLSFTFFFLIIAYFGGGSGERQSRHLSKVSAPTINITQAIMQFRRPQRFSSTKTGDNKLT